MIPILYPASETAFTSNGLGRLVDCVSCSVTEERNGIYECQFKYPVSGEMYGSIQEGCILGVIHDDRKDIQPFDIYARSAPIDGVVTFYAHHISYRLGNIVLKPMSASTCVAALAAIPNNTYNACPFTFWTDKVVTADWSVSVPSAVRAVLGGQAGSILDVYGKGDYEFDKWTVKLYLDRGSDNGVSIRYGVNMTDITQDVDLSSFYTAVVPYWHGEDGTLVTLPEGYITQSGQTAVVPVPLDLSDEWEEAPTVAQLRAKAASRLSSSRAWLPKENIRVSFVDLAHTTEYSSVSALQRVSLCDKVSVYYGDLNVNAVKVKVVRVVYNVLTEMYDEIELGDASSSLAKTITSQFADSVSGLPTTEKVYSMLSGAVDNATNQITGALGGFVRFVYDANGKMQEIVIMDTDDIETATKVWRWNSGGLGYSSNGYGGPYGTAITQDGSIVANFITSGTINANLMRTGIITSPNGGSYWNLDTGELMIGGMSADTIAENVGSSVTGIDIEYAQNQSSSVAPTTGWDTTAPSWASGWYIWQRTKTTTPDGVEYSDPTCISGRDGSSSTPGLNQATVYLYRRSTTQPAAPSISTTYTFATGVLSTVPSGWSRTIPDGTITCWVTAAAAISTDTAVTISASSWQDPVKLAVSGAAIATVDDYFALNDSVTPPATDAFFKLGAVYAWGDHEGNTIADENGVLIGFKTLESPLPTTENPYVWTFKRTTYTDGTVLDSTKIIATVLGADGVGVEDIVEEYYLSTSDQSPTGGSWSTNQPEWVAGKYIWTRSKITWTDGVVTTTTPILAKALNAANEAAAEASAKADTASAWEQMIYRSAASGTISLPANTTWVTNTANAQNVWTTTRPTYSSTYPVLFVATQRQTVEQRSGTTCSCTTPVVDQTTTVIDGGHITTGTIDAGVVNVANIKAGNITSGTISADRIGANSITADKIQTGSITVSLMDSDAKGTLIKGTSTKNQYYLSTSSSSATGGSWSDSAPTWTGGKYVWVRVATTVTKVDGTTSTTYSSAIYDGNLTTALSTAASASSAASSAASAASTAQSTANNAVVATVSCYYRSTTNTTPSISTSTSIGTSATTDNAWEYVMPRPKNGCYFFTCERYTKASGAISFSTVRQMSNLTYTSLWCSANDATCIDGASIYTGSVTAGKIAAGAVTAEKLAAGAVTADKIAAQAVNADKIHGGTLTLGGANNNNGSILMLDADGNRIGAWNNNNIELNGKNCLISVKNSSGGYYQANNYHPSHATYGALYATYEQTSTHKWYALIRPFEIELANQTSATSDYKAVYGLDGIELSHMRNSSGIIDFEVSLTDKRILFGQHFIVNDSSSGIYSAAAYELYWYKDIDIGRNAQIVGNLNVYGTKSRAVTTDQYSDRLLYCYETPTPMFGDIGDGVIGEDGCCYIWLDPIFVQTISTDQYQVFLQKYGEGDCWVKERKGSHFVVQGTAGMAFGWEVKAKQKGYDQRRLDRKDDPFTALTATYGEDAAKHINDLQKERVSA